MAARKPGIPNVPRPGDDRRKFDSSVKEAIEFIIGRRLATIEEMRELGYGWKDLLSEATARATGPAAAPYNAYRTAGTDSVYGYELDTTARVLSGQSHMPHDWAVGTKVYMHVHWGMNFGNAAAVVAPPGTPTPITFRLAWSYARGYGVEAFSAPAGVDIAVTHSNIQYSHDIAEFSDAQAILPDNCETDGLILWSVRRTTAAPAYNPFVFMIDMHYQTDGRDTNERNRTFTKMDYEDRLVAKINEILARLQD